MKAGFPRWPERIDLTDADIEGGELSDITLGVNWHLNPNVRVMFNYVYADLEDRAEVSDDDANLFQARFQIDFQEDYAAS
ncbi:MAG: porin [Thermodesulfobacteriota bacterium]